MADLEISVDIDARGTRTGAAVAKSEIKGVADEAEKAGRKIKSAAEQDIEALNKQLAGLKEFGKAAGIGLTALAGGLLLAVAAAIKMAEVIYNLASSFAEYVKQIGHAKEMTGVSTEVWSALRMQIEKVGGSFDELGVGIKAYIKTIGDAVNGSKEASAKLVRLGIDGKKAANDFDGALRQVLTKIVSLPQGVQQANAAMDAFGETGLKLLPFINSFNGDLDGLIKKAEEFGIVISDNDVAAAKEFNDSLFELQMMIRGVAFDFGRELLPEVERVMDAIGDAGRQNQGDTQSWAEATGGFIHRLISIYSEFADGLERLRNGTHELSSVYDTLVGVIMFGIPSLQIAVELWERWVNAISIVSQKGRAEIDLGLGPKQLQAETAAIQEMMKAANDAERGGTGYLGDRRVPKVKKPKLSDEEKQRIELLKMLKDAQIELEHFGQKSEEAAMRQQLLKKGIFAVNQALANQLIAIAHDTDTKIAQADAAKKAAEAQQAYNKAMSAIDNDAYTDRVNIGEQINLTQKQLDNGRELTIVEQQQIANITELVRKTREWQIAGHDVEQVAQLTAKLIGEQEETLKRVITLYENLEKLRIRELDKSLKADLSGEIADLNAQLRELVGLTAQSRVEQLLLSDAYKELTPQMQAARREQAQQVDDLRAQIEAVKELNRQHAELKDFFKETLSYVVEGDFKGLVDNLQRRLKEAFIDRLSDFLATNILGFDPNATNNPVAKPIVQKLDTTNQILNGILTRMGGTPVTGAGGAAGSVLGAILGGLGGGVASGGNGQSGGGHWGYGTPPGWPDAMNLMSGGHGSDTTGMPDGMGGAGGGGWGNIWKNLQANLFGPRKNILTGKMSKLGGQLGGAGDLAAIAGSLIGGRWGNVLSMAGTGMSIGSMFGAPGAIVGAGVGALIGLFMGDPKKKRDKKEKLPQLEKGFADALAQLRALVADKNGILRDPGGVLGRATELRAQIAGGFGIQFESKKYRNMAQQQITQRLIEADALIAELKKFSDVAYAAGDRDRRLLPEFASGVFMSPAFQAFRRRNGMLGGSWTGRDVLPSMLAHGEMVLNPMQQQRVKMNAGFDVFKTAAIPGYATGGMGTSQPVAMSSEPINMTFNFEHAVDSEGMVRTALKNSAGVQKEVKVVVSDGFANNEINTKRRGV